MINGSQIITLKGDEGKGVEVHPLLISEGRGRGSSGIPQAPGFCTPVYGAAGLSF